MKTPINSLLLFLLIIIVTTGNVYAQTPFTGPQITTLTGASNSYSAVVVGPETVNPSSGCSEVGQTWTHTFTGTTNKRLNGFTITSTSYFVNNYGTLSTIMRRNNASGMINPTGCSPTAVPWNDRQIVFFEGTENVTTNVTTLVNSFPSTTLPGTAGYDAINEMNLVFSRGYINSGADNIFNNRAGTGVGYNSNANNIERMDVFVAGGVLVTAANINKVGIVISCRGPADDPFTVSAIKALTGGGNIGGGTTYIYDDVLKFNATWTSKSINGGGAIAVPAAARVTLISGMNSVVMRRMDSTTTLDDLLPVASYTTISSYVASQNIVAMFFTFGDLGLVAGETFYGYSVGANDVTALNSDQYNSYANSTYYPLTTNPTDGGVDLSGFPGLFAAMDIDDDDDGLPDYLEFNSAVAFQDHDTDGILNYCDATYPGYVDNNADNINDNFDPSADSDNDGIPNYRDSSFSGYVDSNSDSINDNFDWDLDGIPDHLDRDSDNDGIPDVVESFGVDANGDGIIDNYTDTDVDGLSQNVDGNSTGSISSGTGLGAIDTDGDGVPNYRDHDSDNDGIPDVREVNGADTNNNGIIDSYTDTDSDGFSDNIDGDVGNDNFAENSSACVLLTGADGTNDGRADSYPYQNMDVDSKANSYDVDSDGDGIIDLKEAEFADTDYNGQIDGALNSKGWNVVVASGGSLTLPNTDAIGKVNVYDIDSDEDGIPDNVEGPSTSGYLLPANLDTDTDGLDNTYDNIVGFSGRGIPPNDQDADGIPDFRDSDTDSDGLTDIVEGNDLNLNGLQDDNITLTGIDTDNDGLDDRFDNSNLSAEATSARMGNGGSITGDPTPGSITTVQRTASMYGCPTERDWRCLSYILSCEIISFSGYLRNTETRLDWKLFCPQEADHFQVERSTDNLNFYSTAIVSGRPGVNETEEYTATDPLNGITAEILYYRLKTILKSGRTTLSRVITIRRSGNNTDVQVAPNPVIKELTIVATASKSQKTEIEIWDLSGRIIYKNTQAISEGRSFINLGSVSGYPTGVYCLKMKLDDLNIVKRFIIEK